jgi:hypothetical protein
MRHKQTPFAAGPDNILHVRLDHVMPVLIGLVDHVALRRFDDDGPVYMVINDAIAWLQAQPPEYPNRDEHVAALQIANARFESGDFSDA